MTLMVCIGRLLSQIALSLMQIRELIRETMKLHMIGCYETMLQNL